jgi:ABC-2 type transport system permease protein
MNKAFIIAKKEVSTFFDSLIAYVILSIFLLLTGYFTWIWTNNVFFVGQASLQVFFEISYWTFFAFVPAITMRSLSEEMRAGTLELLSTKAITDTQIVMGKYLSCVALLAVALVFTLPYYATLSYLGKVDHGATLGGYLGLLLLCSAYISLGIFASSLTSNQIVAFLMTLGFGFLFFFVFELAALGSKGILREVLSFLSFRIHYESIARGVLDIRDVVFFATVTFLGLFGSQIMLGSRNWKK